jgi:hypothetical protein
MRVYVETSVISYLTARPSRDLIIAGQQELTRAWWEEGARKFDLCYSDIVRAEASLGDPKAAAERLARLGDLTELPTLPQATLVADKLLEAGALPLKAYIDALHVGVCVTNQVDILVSWNCKHIVNVTMERVIERVCRDAGFEPAKICTPVELWGL